MIEAMTPTQMIESDQFARLLGVRVTEADVERVVAEMDIVPRWVGADGEMNPGVVFALADCAMSVISNMEAKAVAVATHLGVERAVVDSGVLRAEIVPASPLDGRAVTWQALVANGEVLVARFTGTTFKVGR